VLATLQRLQLLREDAPSHQPVNLEKLCVEGHLAGGLSVALDVRPDELFGPLTTAVGGAALGLKVLDVRDRPSPQIIVAFEGKEESWKVKDVPALVEKLNAFVAKRSGRLIAVLGEWEEAFGLWCLEPPSLRALIAERDFQPSNLAKLRKVLPKG